MPTRTTTLPTAPNLPLRLHPTLSTLTTLLPWRTTTHVWLMNSLPCRLLPPLLSRKRAWLVFLLICIVARLTLLPATEALVALLPPVLLEVAPRLFSLLMLKSLLSVRTSNDLLRPSPPTTPNLLRSSKVLLPPVSLPTNASLLRRTRHSNLAMRLLPLPLLLRNQLLLSQANLRL